MIADESRVGIRMSMRVLITDFSIADEARALSALSPQRCGQALETLSNHIAEKIPGEMRGTGAMTAGSTRGLHQPVVPWRSTPLSREVQIASDRRPNHLADAVVLFEGSAANGFALLR